MRYDVLNTIHKPRLKEFVPSDIWVDAVCYLVWSLLVDRIRRNLQYREAGSWLFQDDTHSHLSIVFTDFLNK